MSEFPEYPKVPLQEAGFGTLAFYQLLAQIKPSADHVLVSKGGENGELEWRPYGGGGGGDAVIILGSGVGSSVRKDNNNQANNRFDTVSGGCSNVITQSLYSSSNTIGGGAYNTVSSFKGGASILGGRQNTALCSFSTIAGGISNVTSCEGAFVGGGSLNCATDCFSIIVGGADGSTQSAYGFVGGGRKNTIQVCSPYSFLGGGRGNSIGNNNYEIPSEYSVIAGGQNNFIESNHSAILGGRDNNTCGFDSAMIVGACINANRSCTTFVNNLSIMDIPISSAGLPSGSVYRNGVVLEIVP